MADKKPPFAANHSVLRVFNDQQNSVELPASRQFLFQIVILSQKIDLFTGNDS